MNIDQNQQLLQGSNYQAPVYNTDGSIKTPGIGMCIDLHNGQIIAHSGLIIQTDDNNYIKLVADTQDSTKHKIKIKTSNFELNSGNNYLSSTNGIKWGATENYIQVDSKGVIIKVKNSANNTFLLTTSPTDNIIFNANNRTKIKNDGTIEIYGGGFGIYHEQGTGTRIEYILVDISSEREFEEKKDVLYVQDGHDVDTNEPNYVAIKNSGRLYDENELYYILQTSNLPEPYLRIGTQDEVGGVRTIYLTRTNIKTKLLIENGTFHITSNYSQQNQDIKFAVNDISLFFANGLKISLGNQKASSGSDSVIGSIYLGGVDRRTANDFKMDYRGMIGTRGLVPNSTENTLYLLPYPNSDNTAPKIMIGNQSLSDFLRTSLNKDLVNNYKFQFQYVEQTQGINNNWGNNKCMVFSITGPNNFYEAIEFHSISPHDGQAGIYLNCEGRHVPLRLLLKAYTNMTSAQNE